jgi:hypothetical protein
MLNNKETTDIEIEDDMEIEDEIEIDNSEISEGDIDEELTETTNPQELIDYSRQNNLISNDTLNSYKVIVAGVGAGGGWATLLLAKIGLSNIEVYDMDKVESPNIPAQVYRVGDIDQFKVDAIKTIVREGLGFDIVTHNEEITADTIFDINLNTIVLNMLDNIPAKKLVYEKCKGFPIYMIDARMGGLGWSIGIYRMDNLTDQKRFEDSLLGEFREMPCGEKAIVYSALSEVCEIIGIVKKIIRGEEIPTEVFREMEAYQIMVVKRK